MKKILKATFFLMALLLMITCSNDNFNERYTDPSKIAETTIDKMMVGVLEKGNEYTLPSYMRYFTYETQQIGRYAQTLGWVTSSQMYLGMGDAYNDTRWKKFYEMVAQFRILEDLYNKSSADKQKENEIFLLVAKIFLYDHLQQVVDVWGDVPFTKAGMIVITNQIEGSKAPYDKAEDLYVMAMKDLEAINTSLSTMELSAYTQGVFKTQDYINEASVLKWRKYCNSLRLRYAARVAEQGDLKDAARLIVKEILSNATKYPVINNNSENILIDYQPPYFQANERPGSTNQLRDGFESWAGACNRASKAMVDALKDDPRIDVIFDKNSEGNYVGIDPEMSSTDQETLFTKGTYFSAIDTATFSRNNKFPGIIMTASEVDFIRAEACQKWGLAGSVKDNFVKGVERSIEFYYYLNSLGDYRMPNPITPPTASNITTFATAKWDNATNKEEVIATQKWVHYGNILMVQAWNEYRKTGYPKLIFIDDIGSIDVKRPPVRLKYTVNERNYNMENYATVQAKDTHYTPLFWAKK